MQILASLPELAEDFNFHLVLSGVAKASVYNTLTPHLLVVKFSPFLFSEPAQGPLVQLILQQCSYRQMLQIFCLILLSHNKFTSTLHIYRDYFGLYFIFKIDKYRYHKPIKFTDFSHKVFQY